MNKLNRLKIFLTVGTVAAAFSCNTLDVLPVDKIGDENVFTSEKGLDAYFVRLYADLPVLQFIGGNLGGSTAYPFTGEVLTSTGSISGGSLDTWCSSRGTIWDYMPVRDQCYFFQEFPKYSGTFDEKKVNTWNAEVYFIRAFRYFEMVKRYGGVPIIDRVLNYPEESLDEVTKPRNTEKECYEFILSDLQKSIDLFEKGVAGYNIKGRATLWCAYALRARVALHAASLAKYGSQYPSRYANYKNGLTGIPASEAGRYYNIAYDAAKAVINNGPHSLYKGKWGGGSYNDKMNNFAYIFLADMDGVSPETLFAIHHSYVGNSVAYASNYLALQYKGTNSGITEWIGGPSLDMVKEYEDIDGNSYANVLNLGSDDDPVYYDNPLDLFEKAEPRMRASILVPGENTFRKETTPDAYVLDVLNGILPTGKLPSSKILGDVLQSNNLTDYYKVGQDSMLKTGLSGNGLFGTKTGFYIRKSHDPALTRDNIVFGTGGLMPWVEMRYAEVLLTAAEAAVELNDPAKMADAANYVNAIRERAGAFNRNYTAATITPDAVRSEWTKEFFFENKIYWNKIRWRTIHAEINNRQWGAIYPIYVWDKKQYYMKQHVVDNNTSTFRDLFYYMEIPQTARDKNALLVRNHD